MIQVVLVEPQIAPNTGSVGRLCAGIDVPLHLVRPLGFELSDRTLKRAGLDYWPHIRLAVHDSFDDVLSAFPSAPVWCFSARAERAHWDVAFGPDDLLVFGREEDGLPPAILARFTDRRVAIPHNTNIRSLNLSNAVSIAVYEALRQGRERGAMRP